MKFKFWGVRGSIPAPGPRTVRYGGNTTCIEVRSDDGTLIVLDAGTGLFPLAQSLLADAKRPIEANLFISHSHWDHIHGLPFFSPLFLQDSRVRLHGAGLVKCGSADCRSDESCQLFVARIHPSAPDADARGALVPDDPAQPKRWKTSADHRTCSYATSAAGACTAGPGTSWAARRRTRCSSDTRPTSSCTVTRTSSS